MRSIQLGACGYTINIHRNKYSEYMLRARSKQRPPTTYRCRSRRCVYMFLYQRFSPYAHVYVRGFLFYQVLQKQPIMFVIFSFRCSLSAFLPLLRRICLRFSLSVWQLILLAFFVSCFALPVVLPPVRITYQRCPRWYTRNHNHPGRLRGCFPLFKSM